MRIVSDRSLSRGLPCLLDLFLGARDGIAELVSLAGMLIYLSFFTILWGSPSSRRVGRPLEFVFVQQVLEGLRRSHGSTLLCTALFVHLFNIKVAHSMVNFGPTAEPKAPPDY